MLGLAQIFCCEDFSGGAIRQGDQLVSVKQRHRSVEALSGLLHLSRPNSFELAVLVFDQPVVCSLAESCLKFCFCTSQVQVFFFYLPLKSRGALLNCSYKTYSRV